MRLWLHVYISILVMCIKITVVAGGDIDVGAQEAISLLIQA